MLNPKPLTTSERLSKILQDAIVADYGFTQSSEMGHAPKPHIILTVWRAILRHARIVMIAEPAPTAEHMEFKAEIEALAAKWGVTL